MEVRGQLVNIRPISAHLFHNTGLFTQKDPICEVVMGSQCDRTAPSWGQGSKPRWKDSFSLTRTTETEIIFTILNRSKIGIRHIVGQGCFRFLEHPATNLECHIQLSNKDIVAGELLVMVGLIGVVQSNPHAGIGPNFVIVKQQTVNEERNSRGGHRSKKLGKVREVIIVPESFYPPQPYGS